LLITEHQAGIIEIQLSHKRKLSPAHDAASAIFADIARFGARHKQAAIGAAASICCCWRLRPGSEGLEAACQVDVHARTMAQFRATVHALSHRPRMRRTTARMPIPFLLRLQLTSREPEQFHDLASNAQPLQAASVAHGDMVYLLYDFVRTVQPVYKRTALEERPFGELSAWFLGWHCAGLHFSCLRRRVHLSVDCQMAGSPVRRPAHRRGADGKP